MEPDERRVLLPGQQRVARAAEADEAVRELDDGLVRDFDLAKASALNGHTNLLGHVALSEEVEQRGLHDVRLDLSAAW